MAVFGLGSALNGGLLMSRLTLCALLALLSSPLALSQNKNSCATVKLKNGYFVIVDLIRVDSIGLHVINHNGKSQTIKRSDIRDVEVSTGPCTTRFGPRMDFSDLGRPIDSTWKLATTATESIFLYNAKALKRDGNGIATFWVKEMPKPDNETKNTWRLDKIKARNDAGLPTKGYERLSHQLALYQCACNENKLRITEVLAYDEDGKVLDSALVNDSDWVRLIPDSIGEGIFIAACKQQ